MFRVVHARLARKLAHYPHKYLVDESTVLWLDLRLCAPDCCRVAIRSLPRYTYMSLLPLALVNGIHHHLSARFGGVPRRLAHTGIGLAREYLGVLLALAVFGAVCWFFAGWRLRGWRLLLWDLVLPLLVVAAICVVGPGYLFPKEPYEGPRLITFSPAHSLALLDLPGFTCAALAVALACGLLLSRWRERGRRSHRMP